MLRSLRIGFATNSSSAHSVIFHPGDVPANLALRHTDISEVDEYSRDDFVFAEPREKALYIFSSAPEQWLSNHQKVSLQPVLERHGLSIDIIHEAINTEMPFEDAGAALLKDFQKAGISAGDWLDFMLSDRVVMYGYDDNSGDPGSRLLIEGHAVTLDSGLRWRQDGAALVGYSPRSGTKLRWSRAPYEKASAPELVDVKITDYCGFGCKFCYQGSTREGQHAPLERIEAIFDELSDMGVFEVAIGGGEPAHHPQFARIIRAAHARGLTFNFTAFGLDWLKDEEVIQALQDGGGSYSSRGYGMGVGISVHSKRDIVKVKRAREILRENKLYNVNVMAQTVVGATPVTTIEPMLEACIKDRIPLLFLGFKETGRGAGYNRKRIADATMERLLVRARDAVLMKEGWQADTGFHLSVDTAFLDSYGPLLDKLEVPHELRTSPEGKFSMYVDAVENRCGPSSYCDPALMAPINDIKAQFASY